MTGPVGALSGVLDQPYLLLGVIQTAALVAATLLLLYPVVAYAQNVAYTEGVVALAVGLTLVSLSNLVGLLPASTVRAAVPVVSPHPLVVTSALNLLAGLSGTVGVYFFAREFLPGRGGPDRRFDDGDRERPVAGGFESAGDDEEVSDAD